MGCTPSANTGMCPASSARLLPPPLSGSVLPLSVCVFRLQARLHPKQHLLFPASCINEGADAARLSGNESGRTKGRLALHADGSAAPEVSF